jgi:hypothetical protein
MSQLSGSAMNSTENEKKEIADATVSKEVQQFDNQLLSHPSENKTLGNIRVEIIDSFTKFYFSNKPLS